jgi:dTDP-4-amino-4,6-dideoxygalactose transaminase
MAIVALLTLIQWQHAKTQQRMGQRLQEAGIETGLHYPLPIHLQKAYAFLGYRRGDLPVTEAFCDRCLSLPMYAELTDEQISTVVSALRKVAA